MVRAIIFDLYGVLALNGWQFFKQEHFGDREDVWTQIYELGRRVDAGLSDYADLVRFTAEQAGKSEAVVRHHLEHTVANAELLRFIGKRLKGSYHLGILSNASNDAVIEQLFSADQRALFDTVLLSRHVGTTKPDVRMYEAAAERLGVSAEDCLFVDDQERHITGARQAGMQALQYHDFAQFCADLEPLLADAQ